MQRIRRFEDAVEEMHAKGQIAGAMHTSQGQEAEIVGACLALRKDDYMIGNHRSHGHPIGKGAAIRGLMAELMGRSTGVCGGKGGSMHLADFSVGSLGETSIVGSGIPVAAGAALGSKMQGSDRVTLCFFGDGATNEGTFHEGLNYAAIWKLPVIFMCENNRYAVTTPIARTVLLENIADRAAAYGMPGVVVDGQDPLAVFECATLAVRQARRGEGPTLIEAKTYRYREHAANMGRVFDYRGEQEIESERGRDPLPMFAERLIAQYGFNRDELDRIEFEVKADLADAIDFAKSSPWPKPESLFTDVVAGPSDV
jgi:acetoin:2,6-dichlorophenolindophenol oxidoreductase subunit alpha